MIIWSTYEHVSVTLWCKQCMFNHIRKGKWNDKMDIRFEAYKIMITLACIIEKISSDLQVVKDSRSSWSFSCIPKIEKSIIVQSKSSPKSQGSKCNQMQW